MAVSIKITIAQNSQSIVNNTSNVTVKVIASWTYGSYNNNSKPGWVKIDGTTYNFTSNFNTGNTTTGSKTLYTKTLNIAHNSVGEKTLACSASFTTGVSSGTVTASASKALTDIPRAATIDSAPNFNDEANPTITYSNPAGSAVETLEACISLDGSADDIAYRDISKTGSSYTFNLTAAERKVLRQATQGSNSRTVRFYVATTIGGTTYRKSIPKTFTIVNGEPTLSPTVKDTGSSSVVLTGDAENKVIKGFNNMSVAANATAKKEATIKSYKISCGGKSISTASGSLGYVESGTFTFTVTDSRENTVTKTVSKTLINYVDLTCNLSVTTPTADGETTLTVKGNYFNGSFGAVDNTLTIQYRDKLNDGAYGEWQDLTPTLSGNTYKVTAKLTGLDYLSTHTFQARAIDKITSIASVEKKVKTTPVFDWGEEDFNFNVDIRSQENHVFKNGGVGIRGTTTDGAEIQALQPCNSNNNLALGYGGYTNALGATNVYGNEVKLISNGSVTVNGRAIAENKVLWDGAYFMTAGHDIPLTEAVSAQANGIVLVFSYYTDGAAQNQNFHTFFVPKESVSLHNGNGYSFFLTTSTMNIVSCKYLYIYNDHIIGHENNNATGAGNSGITFTNNRFVLRHVIGV